MNTSNRPFWKDEPENSIIVRSNTLRTVEWFAKYMIFIFYLSGILIPAALFSIFSKPLMWIWFAISGFSFAAWFYQRQQKGKFSRDIKEIQQSARNQTGATQIGSAIHVAGHPLLQREQPVVLAIVGENVNIYSYENSIPLDAIHLKNIQSINTVVYDDERVPHIDAIDSAAQALQLTFLWGEQPCTCLFRRMRKMKPIDWYQAIQQVRLQSNLAK
jgi:hypothetical protein